MTPSEPPGDPVRKFWVWVAMLAALGADGLGIEEVRSPDGSLTGWQVHLVVPDASSSGGNARSAETQ